MSKKNRSRSQSISFAGLVAVSKVVSAIAKHTLTAAII